MGTLFSYFEGNLEEYLTYIHQIKDNRLVKTRLAPAAALEDIGIDESYYHVLDNFAVNHILHRHGGKRELLRGQIPVSFRDLLLIPEIFGNYDSRASGISKNGNPVIIYTKDIDNQTYILIEEIRKGHLELATSTLYIRKKKLTDAKSPEDSADSGFASFLLQR